MRINPFLPATDPPPIPAAKEWAAAYDGGLGPLIDLSQAVPGYPPHSGLLARLGAAAGGREAASYGDILGDAALRAAYATHVSALYEAPVEPRAVAITAGCNQAFFVAMIALAGAGNSVILPAPWYFNHKMTLDMLGVEAVPLPCRAEKGFVPRLEDAAPLVGPRTRAIVLVTPNNPTGAVYSPATIAAFHALCAERRIALVLDETYRDFLPADASPPHALFAMPGRDETLVALYSFSKSYCIPGHRVGALVAGDAFMAELAKIMDSLQICAPRTAQLALPWAIEALGEWRAANRDEILSRAAAFRKALADAEGWKLRSIGAYFAYLEHPFAAEASAAVARRLAREAGLLSLPGSWFGPGQEAFLRVAFANVGGAEITALPERLSALRPTERAARRAAGA